MIKFTAQLDGMSFTIESKPGGGWRCESSVEGEMDGRDLTDDQAAATLALAVGVQAPELEQALYAALGSVWDGSAARPVP